MRNEEITQAHVLSPGVEVSFGTLTDPHELAEILVNAHDDPNANQSKWRLYDVGPAGAALIWEGTLAPPLHQTQRVTPVGGISTGGLFELRALNTGAQPTAVPVTATLIGYDPLCCADTDGALVSDFVIVGYGTAGAPLAKFLTDNFDVSVTVIEAGEDHRADPLVRAFGGQDPAFVFDPQYHDAYPANIADLTLEGGAPVFPYQDGRLWAGSSGHNYGLAVRGAPATYNAWAAETGAARWNYTNMLPVFLALEHFVVGGGSYVPNPAQRGNAGPLQITQAPAPVTQNPANPFLQAFVAAANAPTVHDYNNPTEAPGVVVTATGTQSYATPDLAFTRTDSTTAFGTLAIVDGAGFGVGGRQLRVLSKAIADRVVVQGGKATAVVFQQDGVERIANARTEVILCAGAIADAAILQRSGIGDPAVLAPLGISVVVNNPNVGANFQCHYGPSVVFPVLIESPPPFSGMLVFSDLSGANTGPDFNPPSGIRQFQYLGFPDGGGRAVNPGALQALGIPADQLTVSMFAWNLHPGKTGTVKITNTDPNVFPEIAFNFFTDDGSPSDLDRAIAAYFQLDDVSVQYSGQHLIYPPNDWFPAPFGPAPDLSQLIAAAKTTYSITNHNSGTCRMSNAIGTGVVDGALRVFGVTGLRIADNSVIPEINTGNTSYPAYAIGMVAAGLLGAAVPFPVV